MPVESGRPIVEWDRVTSRFISACCSEVVLFSDVQRNMTSVISIACRLLSVSASVL